jgi:hypothetical protein
MGRSSSLSSNRFSPGFTRAGASGAPGQGTKEAQACACGSAEIDKESH